MATDILTTAQRIAQLKAAKSDIDAAVRACQSAEKANYRLSSQTGYVNFEQYWDEIQGALAVADTLCDAAVSKIQALTSATGLVYKYTWTVGRAGVEEIGFVSGFNTIGVNSDAGQNSPFGSTAATVLVAGDKILAHGTTSNDGVLTVDTGPTDTGFDVTDTLTSEVCSTVGASISLLRRA